MNRRIDKPGERINDAQMTLAMAEFEAACKVAYPDTILTRKDGMFINALTVVRFQGYMLARGVVL